MLTAERIAAIRARLDQHDKAIGPGGEKAWLAGVLAADVPALVERVAQAMRDANKPEAWIHQQIVPFDHFARVAVEDIFGAAREAEQP